MICPWSQCPGVLPNIWDTWRIICSLFLGLISTALIPSGLYMNFLLGAILWSSEKLSTCIFFPLLIWKRVSSYWKTTGILYMRGLNLYLSSLVIRTWIHSHLQLTFYEGSADILQVKTICPCDPLLASPSWQFILAHFLSCLHLSLMRFLFFSFSFLSSVLFDFTVSNKKPKLGKRSNCNSGLLFPLFVNKKF